jgi:pimeloyl-ACP methyl ester carboxylesterase
LPEFIFGFMNTPLLLLHGALGAATLFAPLQMELKAKYKVYTFNFEGHGGREIPDTPFQIEKFASEILHFLNEQDIPQIAIFGYSMGGYIATYFAIHHPERVLAITTLATKWNWNPEVAAKEVAQLNVEKMEAKIPAFTKLLSERHHPQNWKIVVNKTADLLNWLGNNSLKQEDFSVLKVPITLLLGDQDRMVTQEETLVVQQQIPQAKFYLLPNTLHPYESVDCKILIPYFNF